MQRTILHVDVNSAFLSWEAARRVAAGEKDIRLIPSAIGGSGNKRGSVILAKSVLAKRFGIKTGEPVLMALRKCPKLYLAKPNFKLYSQSSKAFMSVCLKYSAAVEQYSIDECFIDVTNASRIYQSPFSMAEKIKKDINDSLGITVNIGIGPNKLLAKMASGFEGPNKIHTLFLEEISEKLWPLPVRALFSVGRATAQRLEKAFIRTIGELAHTPLCRVQKLTGEKSGLQIHNFANGIDDEPVLTKPKDAKGYSISTTLQKDVVSAETAYEVLLVLADSVTMRMRADSAKAFCVSVTIRDNNFVDKSRQQKLPEPTDITAEVYSISKQLFSKLWDKKTALRLLGISLFDITKQESAQQSFFNDGQKQKLRELDKTIDDIRSKFGADVIARGSLLQSKEDAEG
ncbi:MAG: DNA polymerase IV [Firmicutes bacterium]|nr:DNA polymerase IV [Bacillota bacterium]